MRKGVDRRGRRGGKDVVVIINESGNSKKVVQYQCLCSCFVLVKHILYV